MICESFPVGPFQCNCVILACEETRTAVVFDPGDEADEILGSLARHQLKAVFLFHTHAHLDHIGATDLVRTKTGAAAGLHEEDMPLCENLHIQASLFGLPTPPTPPIDRFLKHGDSFSFGKEKVEVIHTPGHTPGSVSFHVPAFGLLTGDTLFAGSVGRTDLWGGSHPTLINSIQKRLLSFPDETAVLPGHGPRTTIGRERRSNPFLV
ncbi:MBL fold metallo-hydrolase [Candidatus Manganitrophus noduliformans]|uniref:MBL fold metallo-hydrolase n=1 Tax=Candidatus Manganitrophus noduliformans TaxID=2606439 RepID=A0A7X6DTM4_9BACT|nr:MBL fold metallo-hydrolase [Candidatus Manganitrophus noduliformans]NKE73168.1 MBL fold metallo-hydrolase [Candidatus Manganitrophus noduliformans]